MKLKNLLYNITVALFIGLVGHAAFGLNTYAVAGTIVAGGAAYYAIAPNLTMLKTGVFMMAIQKEIWENHIEEEIRRNNSFLFMSARVDKENVNGRVVHIPQSGGSGNIVKNRSVFPAAIRERNDFDVIYQIDEFTSDPVKVTNADQKELSYDKRNSILGEDRDALLQFTAEWGLYNWTHSQAYGTYAASTIDSSRVLLTTGGAIPASAPGATGNRLAAALKDLQRMRTKFVQEDRWFEGKMYALLPPQMMQDLFPADSVVTATYMQAVTEAERREGVMYKTQGWKIMDRSLVVRFDNTDAILAPGAVGQTTDDEAAIFWYENAVEYVLGDIEFFEKQKDPQYYADIFDFLVRGGGRARRSDYKGIGLLRQAPSV